jgi:hypothetical protein
MGSFALKTVAVTIVLCIARDIIAEGIAAGIIKARKK